MSLHWAAMVAVLAESTTQAKCVVQCAPAAQEPRYAWLVHSIFQLLLSVIPVAGGVWITDRSIRKNGRLERKQWKRNQKDADDRWVRDHKLAEWSLLLGKVAEVGRVSLAQVKADWKEPDRIIAAELESATDELSMARKNSVLLWEFFADPSNLETFELFIRQSKEAAEEVSKQLTRHDSSDITPQQKEEAFKAMTAETQKIRGRFLAFNAWLREEAANDLGAKII